MELSLDLGLAVQGFVTLLVIMDPLGNVPVFLALTATDTAARRRRTARHAMTAAAVIVYVFAFFGTQILGSLSIGLPALQAGGGVVLFLTALEMLKGDILVPNKAEGVNVAVVPLGVPLLAGPGAISAAMVFMSGPSTGTLDVGRQLTVALAIAAVLGVVYLTMRYAELLERLLKDNGIHLVTRVMGMLLIAISIELVATAVQAYVAGASALP
ncbi:MarC family protein [Egicoccus sp. AB-alg6-2]|uniref:MarC family protein n=1 Tax=Egicoccus sp. AB-alg6-2 TaxID=3242692 RepID=UPI00359ED769